GWIAGSAAGMGIAVPVSAVLRAPPMLRVAERSAPWKDASHLPRRPAEARGERYRTHTGTGCPAFAPTAAEFAPGARARIRRWCRRALHRATTPSPAPLRRRPARRVR